MRINTNNIIWVVAALIIVIISIYFFQSNFNKPTFSVSNTFLSEIKNQSHIESFIYRESIQTSKDVIGNHFAPPEKATPKSQIRTTSELSSNNNATSSNTQEANPTPKVVEKITDEDAKRFIPYPFNLALGIFKENDRERYKEFSDTQLSDDWDLTMQGQLVDAIYSHPYANALKVDSIACKAHICEIRLLATNASAWPLVFTDLRQQPWWQFGNNYSTYEFGIKQDSRIQTVYFILLTKI